MSKRILCKFFAHGACLKGDSCEFLHDWKAPPNMICTYYQKGACSYGSRCRYDHVKISQPHQSAPSLSDIPTSAINLSGTSYIIPERSNTLENPIEYSWSENSLHHPVIPERSNTLENPIEYSWSENSLHHPVLENNNDLWYSGDIDPSDRPICSFAAAGNCPRGDSCPHVHGDVCPTCGKQCLHPYRPQERAEHMTSCEKRQKHLEALRRSQEIECSVCLERVLSKTVLSERKFGILSECDHPFCVSCIRNWRGSSSSGFDVNSALRSCPICRKLSYFVIPSVIWYFSQEEKQEIVDSYKSKLSSIDCKHFDFGNGTCPFGTSCFYKHAYRDGRIEEVALRHLGSEDGSTVIARNIRLSDFLGNMRIR